jgi:hypothetical protein
MLLYVPTTPLLLNIVPFRIVNGYQRHALTSQETQIFETDFVFSFTVLN